MRTSGWLNEESLKSILEEFIKKGKAKKCEYSSDKEMAFLKETCSALTYVSYASKNVLWHSPKFISVAEMKKDKVIAIKIIL